jgi:hypothetical protein
MVSLLLEFYYDEMRSRGGEILENKPFRLRIGGIG